MGDVTVTTMDAVYTDGELNWTQTTAEIDVPTVEIDDSTNSITVTGFDFSHNFVAENGRLEGDVTQPGDFHGRKVVIEFTVTPKDGFLGGNQVPTNTADSGVYYEGAAVDTFAVPTVDVPIDPITVTAQDKNVYLMGDLTADQLEAGSTVNVGNVLLDMTADNYGLEAWQNAYVDITATVPTDKTNLTDDTSSYTLGVTVSPKSTGTAVAKSGSDTADIYVFKPEITWKDSQLNVGETVNYEDQNYVSTVWKHGNTLDTSVTMVGTAPKLDYGYAPQASAVTQETKVNVTVKIDGTNVTDFVTFLHEDCDFDTCTFNPDECEFIVHIKSFDLTIVKEGWEAIDENQTFVFNVTGPNGFSMQVVIEGNGSTTIKGLPAGTYIVTEDTAWTWRYETAQSDSEP